MAVYVTMNKISRSGTKSTSGKTNRIIFQCDNLEEAKIVEQNAENNSQMSYVNVNLEKPRYSKQKYYIEWCNKKTNPEWYEHNFKQKGEKTMQIQDSLEKRITQASKASNQNETIPSELTEAEKDSLSKLVSKKCKAETKDKISRMLDVPLSCWKNHGIYGRVIFEDGEAHYITGQSYPDEIRTVRECILNK